MADNALNTLDPGVSGPAATPGDVPERLRRRYFTDERGGPGLGYYVDATVAVAAFRDHGRRLTAGRNDPNAIRDMVAIAQHRGWTIIDVRGQTAFRREAWLAGRLAGLEVRGYRPTERDVEDLRRRAERTRAPGRTVPLAQAIESPGARARLRVVEAVVRDRIVEPAVQARVLETARSRIAAWLERGAHFDDVKLKARGRSPVRDR